MFNLQAIVDSLYYLIEFNLLHPTDSDMGSLCDDKLPPVNYYCQRAIRLGQHAVNPTKINNLMCTLSGRDQPTCPLIVYRTLVCPSLL